MPFPPTCQSPVTCDNRPSRKVGNRWLCLACFEYTEHHKHLPIPEETMSEPIHDQIRAYVQKHGPTHMKQLSAALNIGMSSISSAATTLRREGVLMPAKGDGVIRLTPAPADPTLPDAVPGHPLLWQSPDRQGGAICVRGTRVDVVTLWMCQPAYSGALNYGVTREQAQAAIDYVNAHPELQPPVPEDTVQTSEADVLRAEIDRLTERLSSAVEESMQRAKDLEITREKLRKCQHYSATADSVMEQMRRAAQKERAEIIDALGMDRDNLPEMVDELFPGAIANLRSEVARLTESLATLRGVLDAQGLSTNPAELGNELDNIRASMLKSSSDNRELRAERSRCSAVRLEWSPWQQDSGIWETYLRLKIGNIDVSIGQIVYQHRIYEAALHHSDRDGGVTTTITGTSLADVGIVYVDAMQSAGLPVVSIPTLPESA